MDYIILQAGGRGTRMGYLTANKPKALLPVHGAPLCLHLMRRYPSARFIIIADHKQEVLSAYLALFATAQVEVVTVRGAGNCCGVRQAFERVPAGQPFALIWSDLYFQSPCLPPGDEVEASNWIGLAESFPCRWSFSDQELREEVSVHEGVGGVFLFKDKAEIADIPDTGEICHYLQRKGTAFRPFTLTGVMEIGTRAVYENILTGIPRSRPFNDIVRQGTILVKMPRDAKGAELAGFEQDWYRTVQAFNWDFIPKIHAYDPLTLEWIDGFPLHQAIRGEAEKRALLDRIIEQLQVIHGAFPVRASPGRRNDQEALVHKTFRRLESIKSLLPFAGTEVITINGRRCLNFHKHWNIVEAMAEEFIAPRYHLLHGDPTFSNMLFRTLDDRVFFIDPRGYYGDEKLFGDVDYDWAKLYYSLVGNYDSFNDGQFRLELGPGEAHLHIASDGWEHLRDTFLTRTSCNVRKIEFLHAILWLSLAAYAWDDYDAICAAYLNGIQHMQLSYEQAGGSSVLAGH